jgi:hypothetical protein
MLLLGTHLDLTSDNFIVFGTHFDLKLNPNSLKVKGISLKVYKTVRKYPKIFNIL